MRWGDEIRKGGMTAGPRGLQSTVSLALSQCWSSLAEFMANLTDLSNISWVASTTEAHAADECPGGNRRGRCGGLEQNDNGCH